MAIETKFNRHTGLYICNLNIQAGDFSYGVDHIFTYGLVNTNNIIFFK